MRLHRFAPVLAFTASRYAAAEVEFPFDEPLDELNMHGGGWDTDASLFAPPDNDPYPMTEDPLLNWDSDSYPAVLAEIPDFCIDENQPPSRIRARAGVCVDGSNPSGSGTGVYDPPVPGTLAEQEETKKKWCPEAAFQGILNVPVCSQYEEIQILSNDLTDFDTGVPLTTTGLKMVVTATLSRSCILSLFLSSSLPALGNIRRKR